MGVNLFGNQQSVAIMSAVIGGIVLLVAAIGVVILLAIAFAWIASGRDHPSSNPIMIIPVCWIAAIWFFIGGVLLSAAVIIQAANAVRRKIASDLSPADSRRLKTVGGNRAGDTQV